MKNLFVLFFLLFIAMISYSQTVLNLHYPVSITTTTAQSSDNPDNYTWGEETNILQGLNIYLPPATSPYRPELYMQQDNGRLAFSVANSGSFMDKIEVNYDNTGWVTVYDGTQVENWGWLQPSASFRTIGDHHLKVRYRIQPSGSTLNRDYDVFVVPDAHKFFRDDVSGDNFYRNKLSLWENTASQETQKPVLFVEGFDATNTRNTEFYRFVADDLTSKLLANDYKIYILDFAFNPQDLKRNAAVVHSAIEYISSINDDMEVVVAGASMGGVVSRYTLAKDETDERAASGTDFLPVSHFLSVDAPQQGAVISKELIKYIFKNDEDNYTTNTPAFRQLVRMTDGDIEHYIKNHETNWPVNEHEVFYDNMNQLYNNGYPTHCINVGISFSKGSLNNPDNGDKWLEIDASTPPFDWGGHNDYVTGEKNLPGSLLPLTTGVMNDFRTKWSIINVTTTRTDANPTFIPYFSAQDIVNGVSRHCLSIETIGNTDLLFHDEFPDELSDRIMGVLNSANLTNISVNEYYNFTALSPGLISDNLTVNGTLYLNKNTGSGSSTQPGPNPQTNSDYGIVTYGCNNVTITVNNGGIMHIGDHSVNNQGIVTISKNGELRLKTGSTLIIEESSKLFIEPEGTLYIEDGVSIILDGPDAVLEIRGNLILEDNAVFAPIGSTNGLGYVKFNMNSLDYQNPASPNHPMNRIQVGNNSSMVFDGVAHSKVLEVGQNFLWIDEGLNNFSFIIRDADVYLDQNGGINLHCYTEFDNVDFTRKPGASFYKGIYLWEHDNIIDQCNFSHGAEGLYCAGWLTNKPVSVRGCSFSNCSDALKVFGRGIYLGNTDFENNNQYGVMAIGQTLKSDIILCDFDNTNYRALRFESNTGAALDIQRSSFTDNNMGIKFISRAALNMSCNDIWGRTTPNSSAGLEMFEGSLVLDNTQFKGSGRNSFMNHTINIWLRSAPDLFLNDGYNKLSNQSSGNTQHSIYGITKFSGTIQADNNNWEANGNDPRHQDVFPSDFNYWTQYYDPGTGYSPVFMNDNSALTVAQYNTARASCPYPVYYPTGGGLDGSMPGTTINTTNFPTTPLYQAVNTLLDASADTTAQTGEVISLFNEVLTYPSFSIPLINSNAYLIEIATLKMTENITVWVQEQVTPIDTFATEYQDVMESLRRWQSDLASVTTTNIELKNNVGLCLAHTYNLFNHRNKAQQHLTSMNSWADTPTLGQIDYWLCVFDHINTLQSSHHNPLTLSGLQECDYGPNTPSPAMLMNVEEHQKSNKPLYRIYPNPVNDKLSITIDTELSGSAIFTLYNLQGSEVFSTNSFDVNTGTTTITLDMKQISAGTYFLATRAFDNTVFNKIVVIP